MEDGEKNVTLTTPNNVADGAVSQTPNGDASMVTSAISYTQPYVKIQKKLPNV